MDWARCAIRIEPNHARRGSFIATIFQKYADLPMNFADGCLVATAENLGIRTVATFNSAFTIYRLKGNKRFTIII